MVETTVVSIGSIQTLTWFVAHSLLAFCCIGTTYYARANIYHTTYDPLLWRYVVVATSIGTVYAIVAISQSANVAAITGIDIIIIEAIRRLTQLFFIVLLALSMRELYYQIPTTSSGDPPSELTIIRQLETIFLLIILIQFILLLIFQLLTVALIIHVVGSIAFMVYGVSFGQAIRWNMMSRGTVLDTVATYIVAVLLSLGFASSIVGIDLIGIEPVIIESIVIVLTVMGASFLIALIIRLKQNVDAGSISL